MTKRENGGILPQDMASRGCVSPNADDHLTRTEPVPPPETQVERSGASSCSPPVIDFLIEPITPRDIYGYDLEFVVPHTKRYVVQEELEQMEFDFINPDHPPAENWNYEPKRMLEIRREEELPFAKVRLCKGRSKDGNAGIKIARRKNENALKIVAEFLGVTIAGWND